jgi:hypothetical protein
MPEFIRPKRAIIETGGGDWVGVLVTLVVGALVVGSLVVFVMAHVVLLACCLAAAGLVLGGFIAWSRWISSPKRLAELRAAEPAELPNMSATHVALPRGWSAAVPARRALPAPAEYHLHLHGVSPDEAAEFINRRELP